MRRIALLYSARNYDSWHWHDDWHLNKKKVCAPCSARDPYLQIRLERVKVMQYSFQLLPSGLFCNRNNFKRSTVRCVFYPDYWSDLLLLTEAVMNWGRAFNILRKQSGWTFATSYFLWGHIWNVFFFVIDSLLMVLLKAAKNLRSAGSLSDSHFLLPFSYFFVSFGAVDFLVSRTSTRCIRLCKFSRKLRTSKTFPHISEH